MNRDLDSWVRLDVNFLRNVKARRAGLFGRALYVAGLLYASGQHTDGDVPADVLDILAADAGLTLDQAQEAATRLMEVGLWDRRADGWHIHDFESCQETRAEREKRRAGDRARKQRQRAGDLPAETVNHAGVTRDIDVSHDGFHGPDTDTERECVLEGGCGGETAAQPKAPAKARRKQVPEDFEPNQASLDWAAINNPGVDPIAETRHFVDYHRAKGNTYLDWQRAWINWMRRAEPRKPTGRSPVHDGRPRPQPFTAPPASTADREKNLANIRSLLRKAQP